MSEAELPASVRLSRQMMQHGACDQALGVLTEALTNSREMDNRNEECLLLQERASTYIQAGDARKGLPDAERMITLRPRSSGGYLVKANVLTKLKRHEHAEATLRMGSVQAAEDLTPQFREALQAATAKNILRQVEKDLEAEPGMLGNMIRRLTEAIGEGIPHRHSHQARLRRSELLIKTGRFAEVPKMQK